MTNYDDLNAIFIAAPREMSVKRFTQLVKHYLPKANIVLGIAKEEYVLGFEDQPQFKTLRLDAVKPIIDKVAASAMANKVYVIEYGQQYLDSILKEHTFQRVLLVNGSWKYAFHNLPAYQVLKDKKTPYKHISPFVDEDEAKAYLAILKPVLTTARPEGLQSAEQMVAVADEFAKTSYDYSFQTGASLGRKTDGGYMPLAAASNEVIPYETYALHFGNSREIHHSKPHDTNHYDTIHAEMNLLIMALNDRIDLSGTTLFINLLPCPNCARTLCKTNIAEVVYRNDHSDGYAVKMLELCGKKVRKLVE